MVNGQVSMIPSGLKWGENANREPGKVHIEWHAPCGCAFHPEPFPHIHPCSNEHKRPDLHGPNAAAESMRSACVEKVKALRDGLRWQDHKSLLDTVITALEREDV